MAQTESQDGRILEMKTATSNRYILSKSAQEPLTFASRNHPFYNRSFRNHPARGPLDVTKINLVIGAGASASAVHKCWEKIKLERPNNKDITILERVIVFGPLRVNDPNLKY